MHIPLGDLIRAIPQAWSPETRGKENYTGRHPGAGQCVVSSLLIKRHHGGNIIKCHVGNTTHYFNDLDGVWIDATRAQFGRRLWPYRNIELNPDHSEYIFSDTWSRVDLLEYLVFEVLR